MAQDIREWHWFAQFDWQRFFTPYGEPIHGLAYRRWAYGIWEYRQATQAEIEDAVSQATP